MFKAKGREGEMQRSNMINSEIAQHNLQQSTIINNNQQ